MKKVLLFIFVAVLSASAGFYLNSDPAREARAAKVEEIKRERTVDALVVKQALSGKPIYWNQAFWLDSHGGVDTVYLRILASEGYLTADEADEVTRLHTSTAILRWEDNKTQ